MVYNGNVPILRVFNKLVILLKMDTKGSYPSSLRRNASGANYQPKFNYIRSFKHIKGYPQFFK